MGVQKQSYKEMLMERTYQFSVAIISLCDAEKSSPYSTEILMRQLIRSATSVGANVVEAQASSSKKDFTNFLNHALKSANETCFWLRLLSDTKKVDRRKADALLREATELAAMLGASILKLRKT